MSFQQNILVLAAIAGAATIIGPHFSDTQPNITREAANVTRADEPSSKGSFLGSGNAQKPKKRIRRGCDTNGDLGGSPNTCGRSKRVSSGTGPGKITKSSGGRSVSIQADAHGQFQMTARMNGRRIPVLVDTGASSVAINVRTARRLGIELRDEDFKHEANTANGVTKFAQATIREIRIGGIVVDDVKAAVLSNQALSATLLGTSFLKRLSKYSVESGTLKLTQ